MPSMDRLRAQIGCHNPQSKASKDLKTVIKKIIEEDDLEDEVLCESLME
jgi:hypothetical protein